MREILFRGNRVDNGEWIEGSLIDWGNDGSQVYIIPFSKNATSLSLAQWVNSFGIAVIPETVGQFTGLTDKNGKKIFEGDIVCTRYGTGEICCSGDVQFSHGVYGAEWLGNKKNKSMVGGWGQLHNLRRFDDDIINDIEVIGNIYDNPELLEDEE